MPINKNMEWPSTMKVRLLVKQKPLIVIIGAGICGCSAAYVLSPKNANFLILEASSYLGGKLHTVHVENMPVELGGTWLHCTTPSAKKF